MILSRQEFDSEASRSAESPAALERRLLEAICQGAGDGSVRALARSLLARYRWRDPVHAALFDIVISFPAANPAALEEQLPARLTRRGFPDFDAAALFASPRPTYEQAAAWMQRLRQLSEDAGDDG